MTCSMRSSPKANNNQCDIPRGRVLSFLIILGCFMATFYFWQSQILHTSLPDLLKQMKNETYFPHYNGFYAGKIAGDNILELYYHFLLTFLVVTLFVHGILSIKNKWKLPASPLYIVTVVGLAGLFLMTGLQQVRRREAWDKEAFLFEDKTVEQKNLLVFGQLYAFSRICQQALPGRHQAELITDLDLRKEPFMFAHRILAYYLYPKLSIRFQNNHPKDCLILFYKTNPLSAIPADYRILMATEDQNYILAIRKVSAR